MFYGIYSTICRTKFVKKYTWMIEYVDLRDFMGHISRCKMSAILSRSRCDNLNTLRPRQNGRRFADDTFKRIFLNENVRISIKISLKFVTKGPINNIPALVQIMAWRRPGDKPVSEPRMVRLPTHICVARPQWVNIVMWFAVSPPFPNQWYQILRPRGAHCTIKLLVSHPSRKRG